TKGISVVAGKTYLVESYCSADALALEYHECAAGSTCTSGACVAVAKDCGAVKSGVCDASGKICTDGKLVADATCVVSTDELSITVTDKTAKVLKTKVDKAPKETLTVNVKVKPKNALTKDHLLIVQVKYGTTVKSVVYESKSALKAGSEETFQFTHEIPTDAKGQLFVEAFVWGNWPSTGTGNSLVNKKSVEYAIQ
ncbi:hypothetical protein HQ489_02680, partial [Candidatus Woesearchaeota archaeon]|nr:hypothetical protein [Candidatus Woesearchaeota archaeon]